MHSHTQQEEINKQLTDAAWKGDFNRIKALVEQKADVNANLTNPPLVAAADHGRVAVVHYLIENKANINAKAYDQTALMRAVSDPTGQRKKDFLTVARLLIQSGIDVNAKGEKGKTALMFAVENHNLPATELLIQSGAKVGIQDDNDNTALHWAVIDADDKYYKTDQFVALLLQAGADPNAKNKMGQTPLQWAASREGQQSAERLIQAGADRTALFQKGETELMYAVMWSDMRKIKELVASGVDINAQDQSGKTALMLAAKNHHIPIIEFLVHSKANINIQDNEGYSALLHGAFDPETVKRLIQLGADINVISANGNTILFRSIKLGHIEIVQLLLAMNIKKELINLKTRDFRDSNTPLSLAAEDIKPQYHNKTAIPMALLLLKAGADPFIICDGKSAFETLFFSGNKEMEKILLPLKERRDQQAKNSVSVTHFSVLKKPTQRPAASEIATQKFFYLMGR